MHEIVLAQNLRGLTMAWYDTQFGPGSDFDRGLEEYLDDQMRSFRGVESGPFCVGCGSTPAEAGYDAYVQGDETAEQYVIRNEGTYNSRNGHFWCDGCYIKAGQPVGVAP